MSCKSLFFTPSNCLYLRENEDCETQHFTSKSYMRNISSFYIFLIFCSLFKLFVLRREQRLWLAIRRKDLGAWMSATASHFSFWCESHLLNILNKKILLRFLFKSIQTMLNNIRTWHNLSLNVSNCISL